MELQEAIARRRSIRKYKADPLPGEVWFRISEAGRLAPSANNVQPWRFFVIRDGETKRRLAAAARNQAFIAEAPVLIVAVAAEKRLMGHGQYEAWVVDLSIALDHMSLAAAAEGVGTCWIGAFDPAAVREILGLEADAGVFMLMPFGYPAEDPAPRPRKQRAEIFTEIG